MAGSSGGLFAKDTRRLSRFVLTINGQRPLLLSSGQVEYFSAAFYLRNPLAALPQDALSIARSRFVGDTLQERIVIRNESMETLRFSVGLELASDFADILSVKEHDFTLGDPENARPLPAPAAAEWADDGSVSFADGPERTQVLFSLPGVTDGGNVSWEVELESRERWELVVEVLLGPSVSSGRNGRPSFGGELAHVRDSLVAWHLRVPQLNASWDALSLAFRRSVNDLAALRMRADGHVGKLPAAGMPWFMTVFGRDTIITCLQTLLFGPELARTALHALAN